MPYESQLYAIGALRILLTSEHATEKRSKKFIEYYLRLIPIQKILNSKESLRFKSAIMIVIFEILLIVSMSPFTIISQQQQDLLGNSV